MPSLRVPLGLLPNELAIFPRTGHRKPLPDSGGGSRPAAPRLASIFSRGSGGAATRRYRCRAPGTPPERVKAAASAAEDRVRLRSAAVPARWRRPPARSWAVPETRRSAPQATDRHKVDKARRSRSVAPVTMSTSDSARPTRKASRRRLPDVEAHSGHTDRRIGHCFAVPAPNFHDCSSPPADTSYSRSNRAGSGRSSLCARERSPIGLLSRRIPSRWPQVQAGWRPVSAGLRHPPATAPRGNAPPTVSPDQTGAAVPQHWCGGSCRDEPA